RAAANRAHDGAARDAGTVADGALPRHRERDAAPARGGDHRRPDLRDPADPDRAAGALPRVPGPRREPVSRDGRLGSRLESSLRTARRSPRSLAELSNNGSPDPRALSTVPLQHTAP